MLHCIPCQDIHSLSFEDDNTATTITLVENVAIEVCLKIYNLVFDLISNSSFSLHFVFIYIFCNFLIPPFLLRFSTSSPLFYFTLHFFVTPFTYSCSTSSLHSSSFSSSSSPLLPLLDCPSSSFLPLRSFLSCLIISSIFYCHFAIIIPI